LLPIPSSSYDHSTHGLHVAAASYYQLAADQGDKESQYCLGYAYATGKGVEEDLEDGE
jgi:TPR repeat protein